MKVPVSPKHFAMLVDPPDGRYLASIKSITEEKNRAGTGTNAVYTFALIHDDFGGREVKQYCPLGADFGLAKICEIHLAVGGKEEDGIDTETHLGEQVVVELINKMSDGNKFLNIDKVLPAGTPLNVPF